MAKAEAKPATPSFEIEPPASPAPVADVAPSPPPPAAAGASSVAAKPDQKWIGWALLALAAAFYVYKRAKARERKPDDT